MSRVRLDIGSVVVGGGPVASVITLKPHEEVPGLGMVQLPIRIGIAEASSISAALAHVPLARPLTHDLLASTVRSLGARLEDVTISRVEGTTFYATIRLTEKDGGEVTLDARPSDAIALAMRMGAPLFAETSVLETASYPDFGAVRESEQEEQLASFHSFVEGLSPQDFE
ncbi:MAG: bifunctional nuclease family protein [Atopobiaceae bacterium]|nr:bifunctional nuclease family protein [Atopobiaceae bacterium]